MLKESIKYRSALLLGLLVLSGKPARAEEPEPLDCDTAELHQAAEAGNVAAQNELGQCLIASTDKGYHVAARRWFKAAMDQGDSEAKANYATLLENGIGGPVDLKRGEQLIEQAAEQGSPSAQLKLADRYLSGDGKYKKDEAKVLDLLTQAATGGQLKAISLGEIEWRIGMMHREGTGTDKNLEVAYQWVSQSAESGSINGMLSRAVMLATGEGVVEDDVAARVWYERAVYSKQEGLAHGLRGLGAMLWYGEGGATDQAQGCMMLNLAYRMGDKNAEAILAPIAAKLSDGQKKECNDDAQKWIDENLQQE